MIDKKIVQLVSSLLSQTDAGNLNWEPAARDNWFQVFFLGYTIQLGETSDEYVLRMFDAHDRVLEEISTVSLRQQDINSMHKLERLHTEARRKALGVEDALDKILGALNKDKD
jgi:hypothetical protein